MRLVVRVFPEFGPAIELDAEHLSVEVVQQGELHRLCIFGEEYESLVVRVTPKPFQPRMMQSSEFPHGRLTEEPKGLHLPVDKLEIRLHGERSRNFLYAYRHQK